MMVSLPSEAASGCAGACAIRKKGTKNAKQITIRFVHYMIYTVS